MTIINRVSLFFLLALLVCLLGYSAAMYGLIREHLFHQFDLQLRNSLNVLVAAVEVEPDGVKWQPSDHTIDLGDERSQDDVRWLIVNEAGTIVDTSHNLRTPTEEDALLLKLAHAYLAGDEEIHNSGHWRFLQHRLTCPEPKPAEERDFDESAELVVTVGRNMLPLRAELWKLGLLASILPIVLWLGAAAAGRAYSRHALRPLGEMATRARSMTNADFDLRLPVSENQDELTSLATAFNSLLERLQRAYQQQQQFTGDAAHQLRTPLTVLRGEIDLALRRPRNEEEHRHVLKLLSKQTSELQQIVETLLFLARSEGNPLPPNEHLISPATWLEDYLTNWETHPRYHDLRLEIEDSSAFRTNDSMLRQALDNLIGNALKYSPAGSPIHIRAGADRQATFISVEDRGNGIAPEDRTAVFEPFFRSADARQAGIPGTGLGLAIVARIAQALGGHVLCEPARPQGTTFTLQLPGAKLQS